MLPRLSGGVAVLCVTMFEWNPAAFRRALKVRKLTHQALADMIGVTRPAVTQWTKDRSPNLESLKKLDEAGFPVWILFNMPPPITADEQEIIELWGRVSPYKREAFMDMARGLAGPDFRRKSALPENLNDRRRFRNRA